MNVIKAEFKLKPFNYTISMYSAKVKFIMFIAYKHIL